MAKVFLDNNENYSITNNSEVFGNIGTEEVAIHGVMNTIHSTVERIEFEGALGSYTFAVTGNVVTVSSGASTVATITVPDNVDQVWAFSNGSASVHISGLNQVTLGGAAIPTTAAAITGATLSPYDSSSAGVGETFTLNGEASEWITSPETHDYMMWEGLPVRSDTIEQFFEDIAKAQFEEIGADLNDIDFIGSIEIDDEDSEATVVYNMNDGSTIEVNTTVTLEYLAFLKNMIFDENGNVRLTYHQDVMQSLSHIPAVLTPDTNNGGTAETGYTTPQDDTIVVGRPELLNGAYIDGGSGYNTLEVEMKGVFAQPLELLNIQQINVENMPNIYTSYDLEHGETAPYGLETYDSYTTTTNSALDLTNAKDLELLVVSEGKILGDINGATNADVPLGDLTIAGIRNNATVRLDGEFSEKVTLQFSEGVGVEDGVYTGEVNVILRLGETTDFELDVAHNSSVLHLDSQGYENIIQHGNFGGDLSKLKITGEGALTIDDLTGFKVGSLVKPVVIDASANTGGVDLELTGSDAQFVRILGSHASDDISATDKAMVTIVSANTVANVFTTDDSNIVNITSGSGDDYISSVRGETVTINAGDGNNTIVVSADEINITTGAGNDKITVSGMDTEFVNGDDDGAENNDNYEVGVSDNSSPGALLNINAGAGINTITLGRDVEWDNSTLEFGITALEGSVISGTGIKLVVENDSDLTEADLSAATITSVQLKQELTLTADQFSDIGSAAFNVFRAAFGATEDLNIVISEDTTLSELVNLATLDTHVRLNFEIRNGATLTLTAEELHKYVAEAGIDSTDGLNGKVHITNAGLEFNAFDNGPDFSVIDAGSLGSSFSGSDDVLIDRTAGGYNRPEPGDSNDVTYIDSTGTTTLTITNPIIVDGGNPTTLKIIGDGDVVFQSYVHLNDGAVIDFSDLDGTVSGMTVKEFDNISVVAGNNTNTRINVELTANVGSEDQGLISSGVEKYVVTAIETDENSDNDTATFYMCDDTQDVDVIGLRENAGKTVTFENVPWALVAPTILLEGDGYANYNEALKEDGNPNTSDIGNIVVNFFTDGAPAVVDINNGGVELGVTSTNGERSFDVGSITVNNAVSLQLNVTEGDAVIADINGDDLVSLTVSATEDVTIELPLPTTLTTIDGSEVDGMFAVTLNGEYDATITGGAGVSALTIVGGVDLSEADLVNIDMVVLQDGSELTMNFADFAEIGSTHITVDEDGDTALLNLIGLNDAVFSVPDMNDGVTIGTVIVDDVPVVTLNAATDLTGIDSLTVPEGTVLNLTAAQFQQLDDAGVIICEGSGLTRGLVNITALSQEDVDVVGGLDLSGVENLGTITLAESVNLSAHEVDGVGEISGNLGNAQTVTLGDNMTLGLGDIQDADGVSIVGGTGSVLQFMDTDAAIDSINASGFDVDTLKILNVLVNDENVEEMFAGLSGDVVVEIYSDFGFTEAVERTVIVDAGTTVPGFIVFNQTTDDTELTTLDLSLMGGSVINGDLNLSTFEKDASLIPQHFDTLVINSEGTAANNLSGETANIITGDITPLLTVNVDDSLDNDLKEVVINATQDFALEGSLVFNSVTGNDPMTADDDTEAAVSLTVTGDHDVTIGEINVDDVDIAELAIVNNLTGDAVLTITGGSPAIYDAAEANLEVLTLSGAGDIALGTEDGATGIEAAALSTINASALTGNLDLGIVDDIDSENFGFVSGTGVTTLTLSDALNIDASNDAVGTEDAGWNFDFTSAAAGSVFEMDGATFVDGDLTITLGANTTLLISSDTDLSGLDDVTITGTHDIVLAEGVTLTLTAQQANALNIVAADDVITDPLDPDYDAADVPVVNIVELGDSAVDLSGIDADIAGIATLEDDDVTLAVGTNLGDFTVQLTALEDTDVNMEGQTIRFATAAQAAREVTVVGSGSDNTSTNVVWLFEDIAAPVDTSEYDSQIGRLWVLEDLVDAEGGNVESLFTTLPASILRVDFDDVAKLDQIFSSTEVDRTVEMVAFTELGNLTFSDTGAEPEEHINDLTIRMGGDVVVGDINIADVVASPDIDEDAIVFNTLSLSSELALHDEHVLAPELYVNNNDGFYDTDEYIEPDALNTVGDIAVGAAGGLDLLNVTLATGAVSVLGDESMGAGADLTVGTITFDSEVAGEDAVLAISGANDVIIEELDTTDADIDALTIDTTGMTGTLTVTGASPALQLAATETLNITNGDVAAGTITLGSGVNAGVAGNELSDIRAENFGGTLNLGTLAQIDGTNDAGDSAFYFRSGFGVNTLTLDSVDALAPTLVAENEWVFDLSAAAEGSSLTIGDGAVLGAGDLVLFMGDGFGVDPVLAIDGHVDFSTLRADDQLTGDKEGLDFQTDATVLLNDGSTLEMSDAQWFSERAALTFVDADADPDTTVLNVTAAIATALGGDLTHVYGYDEYNLATGVTVTLREDQADVAYVNGDDDNLGTLTGATVTVLVKNENFRTFAGLSGDADIQNLVGVDTVIFENDNTDDDVATNNYGVIMSVLQADDLAGHVTENLNWVIAETNGEMDEATTLDLSEVSVLRIEEDTIINADQFQDVFTNAAAEAPVQTPFVMIGGDHVLTLNDTGANIAAMTVAQLSEAALDAIDSTSNAINFTAAKFIAANANVAFNAGDTISVVDTGVNVAAMTVGDLGDADLNVINVSDDVVTLTVAQFNAISAGVAAFDNSDDIIVTMAAGAEALDFGAGIGGDDITAQFATAATGGDTIANFTAGAGNDMIELVTGIATVYEEITALGDGINTNANVIVYGGVTDIFDAAFEIAGDGDVTGSTGLIVVSDGADTFVYHSADLANLGALTLLATLTGIDNPLTLSSENIFI